MNQPTEEEILAASLPMYSVEAWFATHAMIRDAGGEKVRGPRPNILQTRIFDYYEQCQQQNKGCMMAILKPRRKGASTGSQAVMYHHGRRYDGVNGTIMGDKDGTSDEIFEIYRLMSSNDRFDWGRDETGRPYGRGLPPLGKTGNTENDIILPGGSKIGKETAGSDNAGRGGTRQNLNITECAHYRGKEKDPTLALLPSCEIAQYSPRGVIIADSTPNGPKGWFYDTCTGARLGKNEWKLIFAAWYEFETSKKAFASEGDRARFIESIDDPENEWFEERRELRLYGGGEDNFGTITPEHLKWRRDTITAFCQESVRKFRSEYPSDPEECFQASAEKYFNEYQVKRCRDKAPSYLPTNFSLNYDAEDRNVSARPDPQGDVKIFEPPMPGCRYLASGDFCTGRDQQIGGNESDPDYHSLQVWRQGYYDQSAGAAGKWRNDMLVAHHRSRVDADVAADILAAMSAYYGRCYIVPEVNKCGLEPTRILCGYGFSVFQRTKTDQKTGEINKAYGWDTNEQTRRTILDHLVRPWRQGHIDVFDPVVLDEMNVFIRNKAGRLEAMAGKHDDTIMALAIAVYNLLSNATLYREPKRHKNYTLRQLRRNPTLMCPDGYRRGPLGRRSR